MPNIDLVITRSYYPYKSLRAPYKRSRNLRPNLRRPHQAYREVGMVRKNVRDNPRYRGHD